MVKSNVVLFIGLVWPEPNSSAAGKRMMQLIELFQNWDYTIVFASTAIENELNFNLSELEIEKVSLKLNDASFDVFVKECAPAVVVFDRFITEEQFGWRVTEHCPDALKILDSEDLHCLRTTRASNFKKNIPFELEHLFTEDLTKREIASILRCDLTLIIAEFEMEILTSHFKVDARLLFYLPLLYREKELQRLKSQFSTDYQLRKDFVFIGNFWHEPNWDSVLYLKKEVWPLIRKQLPNAKLLIYGAYPSKKVFDLHNTIEGFLVLGRAKDVADVFSNARVLIAPLRFGAGLKGKLLDAMAYGLPSITTNIGAESIIGDLHWNGFVENEPESIANKAILLYSNNDVWKKAQKDGFEILNNRFKWESFDVGLKSKIETLLQNLSQHRSSNFIGSLLNHHTLQSTKYLSRWIEEKNKKQFFESILIKK